MSRTTRTREQVKDGDAASVACSIKTDGMQVKHEKAESQDPAFYNPRFKKELKRAASKEVRRVSRTNISKEVANG